MASEVEHRNGEPVIITPVASILTKIQTEQASGFARVEKSLEGKADKGDIIRLETTQREHGDRLATLESEKTARTAERDAAGRLFTRRQVVAAWLLGTGAVMSPIFVALIHH